MVYLCHDPECPDKRFHHACLSLDERRFYNRYWVCGPCSKRAMQEADAESESEEEPQPKKSKGSRKSMAQLTEEATQAQGKLKLILGSKNKGSKKTDEATAPPVSEAALAAAPVLRLLNAGSPKASPKIAPTAASREASIVTPSKEPVPNAAMIARVVTAKSTTDIPFTREEEVPSIQKYAHWKHIEDQKPSPSSLNFTDFLSVIQFLGSAATGPSADDLPKITCKRTVFPRVEIKVKVETKRGRDFRIEIEAVEDIKVAGLYAEWLQEEVNKRNLGNIGDVRKVASEEMTLGVFASVVRFCEKKREEGK